MQHGETGITVRADRMEYKLLHGHHAPVPSVILYDQEKEYDQIIGAEYAIEDIDLLSNAAQRAKEQAMQVLYPNIEDLKSEDKSIRQAAMGEIQKAVLNDDGTRGKLMRTAIIASTILQQLEQLRL